MVMGFFKYEEKGIHQPWNQAKPLMNECQLENLL